MTTATKPQVTAAEWMVRHSTRPLITEPKRTQRERIAELYAALRNLETSGALTVANNVGTAAVQNAVIIARAALQGTK